MTVSGAIRHLDAAVLGRISRQDSPDMRTGRAVVGDAQLPVAVDLTANALYSCLEQRPGRIVNGHQDRDERGLIEFAELSSKCRTWTRYGTSTGAIP